MTAAFLTAAGVHYVFKRKLEAQSICVRRGALLQDDLKKTLEQLLNLNPRAGRLRTARRKADLAFAKAVASGFPPAIAATKAARLAVILQQLALRSRQGALLAEAQLKRLRHGGLLRAEVRSLGAGHARSRAFFHRALAVEPLPASSLSPDYRPARDFRRLQQHQFTYQVDLAPAFLKRQWRQTTSCTITLEGKEGAWRSAVTAGSALSKPL